MEKERRVFAHLANALDTGVVIIDLDAKMTFVNAGMAAMLGGSAPGLLGRSILDFMDETSREVARGKLARRRQGIRERFEFKFKHADGTDVWTLVDASPIQDDGGAYEGSLGIVVDITTRRRAEEALRVAQERLAVESAQRGAMFQALYAAAPDAILVTATDGTILLANPEAERLFGYESEALVGQNVDILVPTASREAHSRHRRGFFETPSSRPMGGGLTLVARRRDGSEVPVDISLAGFRHDGLPAALAIVRDIGHRTKLEQSLRKAEEQLRQSQKMQAVGVLAGGVAHDFNNLLTVIMSCTELTLDELNPGDPLRADIEEIGKAAGRAADLTRQLLAFGRQQVLRPRLLDLNQVVQGMDRMLRRLLGDDCELSMLTTRAIWKVHADPGQLELVIMNLVVNARDAMPRGGRIVVETVNVMLDADYVTQHIDVKPGPHVMLAVTDTGVGMDAATRERVFDPFFTTKEKGKGTGLGLSTVHGIVKQSGGHVWVYSEPGNGTTFRVYLPRASADTVQSVSLPPEPITLRGTETILLVEDDDQVRAVARTALRRAGYNVLDAQNGGEAFLTCEKYPAPIHLLLTDVVMPRMSGRELAERLAPMRPGMRVLYISGYTENSVVHNGVLESGIAFLQKPLTPEALLRRVREVLTAAAPPVRR